MCVCRLRPARLHQASHRVDGILDQGVGGSLLGHQAQLSRLQARQIQYVVDQRLQMKGITIDDPQITRVRSRNPPTVVLRRLHHELAESDDEVERRAQFVADRLRKLLFEPARFVRLIARQHQHVVGTLQAVRCLVQSLQRALKLGLAVARDRLVVVGPFVAAPHPLQGHEEPAGREPRSHGHQHEDGHGEHAPRQAKVDHAQPDRQQVGDGGDEPERRPAEQYAGEQDRQDEKVSHRRRRDRQAHSSTGCGSQDAPGQEICGRAQVLVAQHPTGDRGGQQQPTACP